MKCRRLAIAATVASASACTLLTDLDGLSGPPSAERGDGGSRESSVAPTLDATADATLDAGAPCDDPAALVGRSDRTGLLSDSVPDDYLDAYPFVAPAAGTARCVWVWVDKAPASKQVQVGIYSDDPNGGAPKSLRRSVAIADVKDKSWFSKPLLDALVIAQGDRYWLGISPVPSASRPDGGESIGILNRVDCTSPPSMHSANFVGALPNTFFTSKIYATTCDAAVYLGR